MTTANGTARWTDTTANGRTANDVAVSINPRNFPVSGIALDPSDTSGNTAYVTIMGFGSSHIWRTVNAGATWKDFSGPPAAALPDAPANTVAVDSGTVYVGTDVGVFSSGTADAQWVEVGGAAGALPDVPVTALRIFYDGATRLLRVATYGRGVWQFPLAVAQDFQIAFSNPKQIVFPSQTATFNGTVVAFDGYSNPVALKCTGTKLPAICTVAPGAGGSFTVTAAGAVGDYSFSVQGVDTDGLTRSSALSLHVVDFGMGAPSPAAITLQRGTTSNSISLAVTFLGSFPCEGTVNLSCTAPTGVTCNFFPGATVNLAQGNPANVTLTVVADSSVTPGSSTMGISASSSAGDPKTVSQPLALNVLPNDDDVTVGAAPAAIFAGQAVALQGTVTFGLRCGSDCATAHVHS